LIVKNLATGYFESKDLFIIASPRKNPEIIIFQSFLGQQPLVPLLLLGPPFF
jgi:hypothetical protein